MSNRQTVGIGKKSCLLLLCFIFLPNCVSHLQEAKFYYARGQRFSHAYNTEQAISSFKKALREATLEARRNPSSQAFMLKGMAALELKLWDKAEQSFVEAFSYGFENGQEWAKEISLLGLALSFEELGLEDTASTIYAYLIQRSKLRQILLVASQRFTDMTLESALRKEAKEKEKSLTALLKSTTRLVGKDMSCGFFHYLLSQIYSHLALYRKSFEEAVMAKELGLPTKKIFRDNDLQIVFCYQRLKEELIPEEWKEFDVLYSNWLQRWNWPGATTPDWKKR